MHSWVRAGPNIQLRKLEENQPVKGRKRKEEGRKAQRKAPRNHLLDSIMDGEFVSVTLNPSNHGVASQLCSLEWWFCLHKYSMCA